MSEEEKREWPKRRSAKLMEAHPDWHGPGVYLHWCPGCNQAHPINTGEKNQWNAIWSFDGNFARPTFNPSINIVGRCHYFIREGNIQFCGDSKHALAGKTVPLPDFPEDW